MGLDMFAYAVPSDKVGDSQVDVKLPEDMSRELAYWRKLNHLHGWMHRLYDEKGGTDKTFNCSTVRLTEADLSRLEKDLAKGLPPEAGFFFGGPEIYPEDIENINKFIAKARAAIADGEAVFYDSWW